MDEVTPEVQEVEIPAEPTVEDAARAMGWRPKEEYEGDPGKWVNAEIFVARAPLFDKIEDTSKQNKSLKRELDTLKMTVKELAEHNQKIKEVEYKRAIDNLKAARRDALENQDLVRADEIEEHIEVVRDQARAEAAKVAVPEQPQQTEFHEEFVKWTNENQWYKTDNEMRDFADAVGIRESRRNRPAAETLRIITAEVKKVFPDKFRNPMKDQASPVETQAKGTPAKAKTSRYVPTEQERQIAKRFVDQGVFKNVEDYYEQLAQLNQG